MEDDSKLVVTYFNKNPIDLIDLSGSLLAIGDQYSKFVKAEIGADYTTNTKLFVSEVKTGSIVIELIQEALPIIPLLWQSGSFSEWVKYITDVIGWTLEKYNQKPDHITENNLKQINKMIEPVCNDSGSQMTLVAMGNSQINIKFEIGSLQANFVQNRINKLLEKQKTEECYLHRRKIMYWYQTRFAETTIGDKVIIESISKTPLKVLFENSQDKEFITETDNRFKKPWQKLAYVVDVEVQTINEDPKAYTIKKLYREETFDPCFD